MGYCSAYMVENNDFPDSGSGTLSSENKKFIKKEKEYVRKN